MEENLKTDQETPDNWEPKIVGFLCQWCSYAGADLAGSSRRKYPPNLRVIRVPCSGRVDPMFVVKALRDGVDGILVSGCHPGDCHYTCGNMYARRKFTVLRDILTFMGIDPLRIHFVWVSASEGDKFVEVVKKVTAAVKEAGPNKIFNE